ncbi:MAG: hypothetical protein P8188_07920 [Gemmatimonadota bacterium]
MTATHPLSAQASGPDDPAPVSVGTGSLELEEILLELEMGRMSRSTVPAYSDGSEALLPLGHFLELAEVEFRVDSVGVLRATLHPGGHAVVVDPRVPDARRAGHPVELAPGDVIVRDDGVFMTASALGRLLDLDIRTDWMELSVVVMNPRDLPLGRRLDREARWRNLRAEREGTFGIPRVKLDTGPVGGAVLDWSLFADAAEPTASATYSAGLGARVLGGKLRLSARSQGPASDGHHRVDATYHAVLDHRDWIRQVRVGDGFGTGPRIRDMRGLALSNAPYVRPSFFGVEGLAGRVGPGWEVELRRSGRTLDLTRADEEGAFALDIPVRYGENAVQVVAFGPHGQVVTSDRLLVLSRNRLPPGRLEWGLSAGECRSDRCVWTGNADLWYGVSRALTIRGGTEAFGRDSLPSLVQPYLGVTAMPLSGLELSAEAVYAGFLRGGLSWAPSSRIRVRGAFTDFSSRARDPVLHNGRRRSTTEADLFFRPLRNEPRLFVRGSLLRQSLETGVLTVLQMAGTVPVGQLQMETGLRRTVDTPRSGGSRSRENPFAAVSGMIPVPAHSHLWVRGEVELDGLERASRLRGQAAYQVTPGVRFQAGASWDRTTGSTLDVAVSAFLDPMQSITQVVTSANAPTRLTQLSRGTVSWNEASRRVSFHPGPGVDRGASGNRTSGGSKASGWWWVARSWPRDPTATTAHGISSPSSPCASGPTPPPSPTRRWSRFEAR